MLAARVDKTRLSARHALAGLEAGVLGALLLIGWLMLGSIWLRHSVWSFPNLMAIALYGPDAYSNQFGRSSLAGCALLLVIYGLLGAFWGAIWKDRRNPFLILTGVLTGLAVYALFFGVIWKHACPLIALYAPDRQLEVAHILWGLVLARSPQFSRNIALAGGEWTPPPAVSVPPPMAVPSEASVSPAGSIPEEAGVRSGEATL
ncbi:MAG: hypothetical protein ABUS49_03135 [Acidobacteriota bacterium]